VPDNRKGSRREPPRSYYGTVMLLATIPFTMGVAPVIGWWFGRFADRKLGTDWVFQVVGLVLGLAAAGRETYLLIRRVQRDLDRQ
jgi:hypothetical protein